VGKVNEKESEVGQEVGQSGGKGMWDDAAEGGAIFYPTITSHAYTAITNSRGRWIFVGEMMSFLLAKLRIHGWRWW
jgi:hypothetical protein